MRTPNAMVLGGGGILGEAWMSAVLAGLEDGDRFDARGCERYIGTSAGSIVAASLVAGLPPSVRLGAPSNRGAAPAQELEQRATAIRQAFGSAAGVAGAAVAPLASLAFASTASSGAIARRVMLRGIRPGSRSLAELGRMVEQTGVRWDGRLRIVAVELESGERVVFGDPDAPAMSVASAVQASCAIPGVFRPVVAGKHSYVDGGVWSPTNMDIAEVAGGDRVLCLNPTGSLRPAIGTLVGAFGPVSRALAGAEALVLKDRGASVIVINPDQASAAAMGRNLMDPRPRPDVIEAGWSQGRGILARGRRDAA